jgi:predicted dienelactone hydrolase
MRILRFAALAAVITAAAATPAAAAGASSVGHQVKDLTVSGSGGNEPRPVKVHLWYPATEPAARHASRTVYTSRLFDASLASPGDPAPRWDPLAWTYKAELARDTTEIDPPGDGKRWPVIVFSHGSTNDPIDYASTLEEIAAAGFVVAAPYHVNNTQDDARADFVNMQAGLLGDPFRLPCDDTLPGPCSRTDVPRSMRDRERDIVAVLDALKRWFPGQVDAEHVGVLGHSRGTVSALTAAGGSTTWGIGADPRVKAVMGMAIGAPAIVAGVNLPAVTVPTMLVAGGRDTNPANAQTVSRAAFDAIASADKLFVTLPNATHRSFDGSYCAQLQAAGAVFDTDGNGVVDNTEVTNTRPLLDRHTVALIGASAPAGLSGKAVHYCAERHLTSPVDIRRLLAATPNAEYACDPAGNCAIAPPTSGTSACASGVTTVPCTGLDSDEVKAGMTQIAAAFFGSALRREAGLRFTHWLSPAWLTANVPMIGSAEAHAGQYSVCPPGEGVICAD